MIKFILHYFIPHPRNNHRSKIIHNSSLLVIVVFLLFSSWFSILINSTKPEILGISYSISDQELLLLVNEKRLEKGLEPLKINEKLSKAAREKANHMFENNYWAHFAPDNTSPWKFFIDSGYDYIYAGENLAKGFYSSRDAVDAWMGSPTHRDNILSAQYEDVGFAIVEGNLQGEETVLIVELFGQEKNQFLATSKPDIGSIESSTAKNESSSEADVNDVVEVPLLGTQDVDNLNMATNFNSTLYQSKPIIDVITSAKTLSFILTSTLLIALVLDLLVILRRKIPRLVGDNLDHILLLSIFLVFIFIYNLGRVL